MGIHHSAVLAVAALAFSIVTSDAGPFSLEIDRMQARGVAGLVGNEGGVVSGLINLESSGVEAPDWRPRHDEHYHEA
jgi:hypothetical protein